MSDMVQLCTLIELVEKFLFIAKKLLENGVINQETYISITENKVKFLEDYRTELKS